MVIIFRDMVVFTMVHRRSDETGLVFSQQEWCTHVRYPVQAEMYRKSPEIPKPSTGVPPGIYIYVYTTDFAHREALKKQKSNRHLTFRAPDKGEVH